MSPLLVLLAPILLERRIATVESVVAELAAKSGRPLAIRRGLRDEVLYVGLGAHDSDTLMALLAKATSAEWTEGEGKTWLGRSTTLERKLAGAEQAQMAKDFSTGLGALLPAADPGKWGQGKNAAGAIHQGIDSHGALDSARQVGWRTFVTPIGRLFAKALRSLSPLDVAAIPVGETARFASRPRVRQGPLPGVDAQSLRQYADEQRVFLDEMAGMTEADRTALQSKLRMFRNPTDPGSGDDLYALLTVSRRAGDSLSISLGLFSQKGKRVDQTVVIVETKSAPQSVRAAAPWKGQPLKLSPEATSFYDGMRGRKLVADSPPFDPVAQDPLIPLIGDAVSSIAQARGGETIEALPDEVETTMGRAIQANANLGKLDEILQDSVVFESVQGVRVGHARFPVRAETNKMDRSALASLLVKLRGGAFADLDTLSNYIAQQSREAGVNRLEWDTIGGAGYYRARREMSPLLIVEDGRRDLIRAYGGLSLEGKAAFRRGAAFAFNTLPPQTLADLSRFTFRRQPTPSIDGSLTDASSYFDDLPGRGTFALASFVPGPFVVAAPLRGGEDFISMTVLANLLYRKEAGTLGADEKDPTAMRFVPGWRAGLTVELRLSQTFKLGSTLADLRLDPSAGAKSLDQLPKEFQLELQRLLATIRARKTQP